MKNVIKGLLSRAYKIDDGKIAELLDGENVDENELLSAILNIDKTRVEEIKTSIDTSGKFQDGYAKAKKEERVNFENEIKEKFGVESEKMGTDLIEEILTVKGSGTPSEMSEQEIKKSPVYRTMESAFKTQLTEKETELTNKIKQLENDHKKERSFLTVKERASKILTDLDPVLPKIGKVAETHKATFFNALNSYDFETADDGSVIVSKDGKIIEDGHGHSRNFDEIVKDLAGNYFEFAENNGGQNAGNKNTGGAGSGTVQRFKTEAELFEYSNNNAIPLEDRLKAVEEFNKSTD